MGTGSAFGEATLLGYLRLFPDGYVVGWSSGTGLAGVAGASITLFAKKKGVNSKYLYLFASPLAILYYFAFFATMKMKNTIDSREISKEEDNRIKNNDFLKLEEEQKNNDGQFIEMESKGNVNENKNNQIKEIKNTNQLQTYSDSGDNVALNKTLSLSNFVYGFKKGKRFILTLAIVYFLEYVILYGFGERISKRKDIKLQFFQNIVS